MSARSLMQAAAGAVTPVPTVPTDPYWYNVTLLLDGNTVDVDPYFSNVGLLLTGDGIASGTTFIDYSTTHSVVTTNGSIQLSSTVKKYRSNAIFFPYTSTANPNYLTVPFVSGGLLDIQNNWTIEFWFYRPSASGAYESTGSNRFEQFFGSTVDTAMTPFYLSDGKPTFWTGSSTAFSSTALTMDMWYHIAVVCNSNTVTCYLNGVAQATTLTFSGKVFSGGNILIGRDYWNNGQVRGYIDDLRITKGIARYTSNFNPPLSVLPSYQIIDTSSVGSFLVPISTVNITSSTKKYGSGSISFNGNGSYMYYPGYSTIYGMGSLDWTVEAWVNLNAMPTSDAWPTNWSSHMVLIGVGSYNGGDGFNCMIGQTKLLCHNNDTPYLGTAHGMVINTWYHIAFVRYGNTLNFYVNGVAKGSVAFTGSIGTGANTYIGAETGQGAWLNGYVDDLRVSKGIARYTTAFSTPSQSFPVTAAATTDPYINNVSLLLTADSTDVDAYWSNVSLRLTGDDLTDYSNNHATVTVAGNTRISSTNKKYGTGSLYFNGSSGCLTTASNSVFAFGTGDFTVEYWMYYTSASTAWGHCVLDTRDTNSNATGIAFSTMNNGAAEIYTNVEKSNAGTATINTWNHYAFVRSAGTLTSYINGVSVVAITLTQNFTDTTCVIGSNNPRNTYAAGYIDDLRVTKGVARYTSTFTPPTTALPTSSMSITGDANWSSVSLRLTGDDLLDKSPYNLTVTNTGSVSIDANTKKYGTGSMAFSGSNYLTANAGSLVAMGTGNYTVEFWFYQTSVPGNSMQMFDTRNAYLNGIIVANGTNRAPYFYSGNTYVISSVITNLNQWYHIAAVRSGTTMTMYLNGVNVGSATSTDNIVGTNCYIGQSYDLYQATFGYIDDLRVTKGVARYTANFTPPTAALPLPIGTETGDASWNNVSLLLNGDTTSVDQYWNNVSFLLNGDTISDSSKNHIALTNNNSVTVSTSTFKYGTGSLNMTGSDKYISFPASTATDISTGDFTFECWVNFNSFGTDRKYVLQWDNSGSYWQFVHDSGFGASLRVSGYTAIVNQGSNAGWSTGTWYHVALVRFGSTFTIYRNGISIATSTSSASIGYFTGQLMCVGGNTIDAYFDDIRFTKGIARYTSNFAPGPVAALPTFPLDKSPNSLVVTSVGDTSITSNATYKFGTGSMYFDGSGDYLTASTTSTVLGSGDFTLELWYYPTAKTNNHPCIISNIGASIWGTDQISLVDRHASISSTKLTFFAYNYATSTPLLVSNTSFFNNVWYHITITRSGSVFKLFINGTLESSGTFAGSLDNSNRSFIIGAGVTSTNDYITGYIDDLRITKGVDRYPYSFTVPTSSLPNFPIMDKSPTALPVTPYGNVQVNSLIKKYGTGSMYFDGSGDYLTVSPSTDLNLSTGDFTIEFWGYRQSGGAFMAYTHDTSLTTIGAGYFVIGSYASGAIFFYDGNFRTSNINPGDNVWFYVTVTRSSGTLRVFVNGILGYSGTIATNFPNTNGSIIGKSASSEFVTGYIDDLRITKGVARYTANFTPPTILPTS